MKSKKTEFPTIKNDSYRGKILPPTKPLKRTFALNCVHTFRSMKPTMEGKIDLTLESIHGVARRPCGPSGEEEATPLSAIKGYVSFSGSIRNMKVSSFAMCPEKGSLVVESKTPEIIEISDKDTGMNSKKTQPLNTTFTDPFEETRLRQSLSSGNCSSSNSSHSSCRPHLQFQLQTGENVQGNDRLDDTRLKLHVVFRSTRGDAADICPEGIADLILPSKSIESLPLVLDLPIKSTTTETTGTMAAEQAEIFFESSAFIRVRLDDSTARENDESIPSMASKEYVLSDYMDEIQLVGMVRKIHEDEKMMKIRDEAMKPHLKNHKGTGSRLWSFNCGGPVEIKKSFQALIDGLRGARKECVDPDPDLLTSITMTSTIDTRDSIEKEMKKPNHHIATPKDLRYEF